MSVCLSVCLSVTEIIYDIELTNNRCLRCHANSVKLVPIYKWYAKNRFTQEEETFHKIMEYVGSTRQHSVKLLQAPKIFSAT